MMTFDEAAIIEAITRLECKGIVFEDGLTDAEMASVQRCFGFVFPPELAFFLRIALPVSRYFPDWRHESETSLRNRFIEPIVSQESAIRPV